MSAITPPILTPIHDEEIEIEIPTAEETTRKIAQNINFLADLLPLGHVMVVNINQLGFTPISTDVFQLLDGSEITHPFSPLRSLGLVQRFTPNVEEQYPRCATAASGNGTGGSFTFPTGHSHGGSTGGDNPGGSNSYDEDEDEGARRIRVPHNHSISSDLDGFTVDYPQWFKVAAYMKIR